MKKEAGVLKICEIFTDIEGEGRFQGIYTLFIRLSGCNLRCRWCDTKYAYTGGRFYSIERIASVVNNSKAGCVSITGGEPLLYKKQVAALIKKIKNKTITVETNGSVPITGIKADNISMDLKLPGSGEHKKMFFSNLQKLRKKDQVKLVISSASDMNYARRILGKYRTKALIVAQPVYRKFAFKEIKNFVLKKGLDWKVSIQLHKL